MKLYLPLMALCFAMTQPAWAQGPKTGGEDAEYTRVITQRSQKIVDKLDIADPAEAQAVLGIIVQQYRNLNGVQETREAAVKAVKASGLSGEVSRERINRLDTTAMMQLEKYHRTFVAKLSARLTPEQVTKVKDAMTYNVLEVTYKGYLAMLPDLTPSQKTYIMACLIEAREYAMDGGSSEEKHKWFGKYKGRINNYLSKEGYDLGKASKEWAKRRAAAHNKNS